MSNAVYGRKIVTGTINNIKVVKRRIYISWFLFFVVGLIIGCILFYSIAQFNKTEFIEPVEIESLSYGTIDGKEFTKEISMDWSSGVELGFVPLDVPMDEDMQEFIYCLSYGYNIEFTFIMALIEQESSFRTNVKSNTGDYGLMQINEINHEWLAETLGITDFNDPYQNTRSGIFILRKLFEKYEDPAKVLMAYNMGETGARRLWEKGIYETDYSSSIMKQAVEYKNEILEKESEQ